ncbi:hypothetical protein [Hyalangium gracile]|uniref:hypothetical protein n=1 Tax=Hyalangium gracile TaxID=394092 RepID=UPI001CCE5298|nr:hypothetical protein [Hyalangium gracile]
MYLPPRIALALLMILPLQGLAQTSDAPVASPERSSTPPLVTAPPESETPPAQGELIPRRRKGADLFVPRLLLGSVLGTATGTAGAVLGFLGGSALSDCNAFDDVCDDEEFVLIAGPTLLGTVALSSMTVYGVGSLFNGQGSLLPTVLGAFAGTGVGMVVAAFAGYTGIILMPPLAAIGSIIGYEVSHSWRGDEPRVALKAGSDLQMIPVFSVTPGGGVLGGLTGRF